MQQQFSLAYLTVFGLSPPQMIGVAADTGYDYVSLRLHPVTDREPVFDLAVDGRLLNETKRRLSDTGVGVLDVELIRMTPGFAVTDFLGMLDVAAELGAKHIIAQAPDADDNRACDHLMQLCDAADQRNLTVNLEFVTWTETRDLNRAATLVSRSGRDNAGILIDALHFTRSGCAVDQLAALPRSWFRLVQLCDAPGQAPPTTEGLIHAARNERLFLGEGDIDLRGIVQALPANLPCSLEIPRASLAREIGLQECARKSLLAAQRFFKLLSVAPVATRSTGAPQPFRYH